MPSATLRERLGKLGWVSSESYMKKEKFESSITHQIRSMTILQQKTESDNFLRYLKRSSQTKKEFY